MALPFQTVETINESAQECQLVSNGSRPRVTSSGGTVWSGATGKVNLIYIDLPSLDRTERSAATAEGRRFLARGGFWRWSHAARSAENSS